MWSGTYIDAQDQDAVLLCRAAGNPHPKITWIDNEDKVIKNYHGDFQVHHAKFKLLPFIGTNYVIKK